MSKKLKTPKFSYENGYAKCVAEDNLGRKFIGEAWCAEEDKPYESELIGCTIAEMRAQIEAARTYRNDIKIKLSALYQYYYSENQSKHFTPQNYENKMLRRQIKMLESDLKIAEHQLAVLRVDLYEYINDKDQLHKKLKRNKNV